MNNKKEDEVYCAECGKPIKRRAVICPHCGVQVKELETSSQDTITRGGSIDVPKSKVTAVVLAVLFGFWSWAYTYGRNAKYFWIGFGVSFFLGIFFIPSMVVVTATTGEATTADMLVGFYFVLLGLWGLGSWSWAIVDNAVKPSSFYENYPSS